MLLIVIFAIIIFLFLIFNSIIWIKNKKITNINDKIIKYIIYFNFIFFSFLILFLSYLYFYNLKIIIN